MATSVGYPEMLIPVPAVFVAVPIGMSFRPPKLVTHAVAPFGVMATQFGCPLVIGTKLVTAPDGSETTFTPPPFASGTYAV